MNKVAKRYSAVKLAKSERRVIIHGGKYHREECHRYNKATRHAAKLVCKEVL